ncbi:putative cytochrome P450 oxidoreductase [Rosellinia necatrix]|uniref:Putative cytochrome P450 oxidoreductase n=1 Tax=Rosellinia necatrix TaxID=77044 RepID=A0A1W2TT06_ROSNE|nr:putative cytochrome P450 oxidoreductase [Rosellinia necatrix]
MLIPLLVLGLPGLWLAWSIFSALWSPLRSIPGSFLSRFTDGWYLWRILHRKFQVEQIELHRKYGPIVRLGPKRFSFADADALKTIYGHGIEFRKSKWYSAFNVPNPHSTGQENIFTERDPKLHAQQRKQLTNMYSMSGLMSCEPYVDECTDLFAQRLTEFARAGNAIDMGHWLQCFSFDAIGLITSGDRYGFLDYGDDIRGIMGEIEAGVKYSVAAGIYPRLHQWLNKLLTLVPKRAPSGLDCVLAFAEAKIAEFEKNGSSTPTTQKHSGQTFFAKMFNKQRENPKEFTSYHILTAAVSNIGAGSDTTSIALSSILYYLIKHPRCMTALREEIDNAQRLGLLSARPKFNESQDMPYFQAVIKESMRLHPSIQLPYERIVPDGGATISGRFFPAGTTVSVNPYVEHRIESVWGEDAEEFRPERWLISNKDQLALMNRHWIPFGTGSRTCLGKNVSLLEIHKLVLRIVRDFDFKFKEGSNENWETENFWIAKPKGWQVEVSIRGKGVNEGTMTD